MELDEVPKKEVSLLSRQHSNRLLAITSAYSWLKNIDDQNSATTDEMSGHHSTY
jgi:hypothetical protein